jgi:hypothetical protein
MSDEELLEYLATAPKCLVANMRRVLPVSEPPFPQSHSAWPTLSRAVAVALAGLVPPHLGQIFAEKLVEGFREVGSEPVLESCAYSIVVGAGRGHAHGARVAGAGCQRTVAERDPVNGWTPLMVAALSARWDAVDDLLETGLYSWLDVDEYGANVFDYVLLLGLAPPSQPLTWQTHVHATVDYIVELFFSGLSVDRRSTITADSPCTPRTNLRIAVVPGAGRGLFVTAPLTPGTLITAYGGVLDVEENLETREYAVSSDMPGILVDGSRMPGPGTLVNHSATAANAEIVTIFERGAEHRFIRATKHISPDEQVLLDYGADYEWPEGEEVRELGGEE